jgi:hypothetical protein
MELAKAKYFVYRPPEAERTMYKSRDLQTVLNMTDNTLIGVYACIDTDSGETLMETDFSYSGEPIIMGRFIHVRFMENYCNKIIDLDKE